MPWLVFPIQLFFGTGKGRDKAFVWQIFYTYLTAYTKPGL